MELIPTFKDTTRLLKINRANPEQKGKKRNFFPSKKKVKEIRRKKETSIKPEGGEISLIDDSKLVGIDRHSYGYSHGLKDEEKAEIRKTSELERKFTARRDRVSVEELMKTSCYQRFCRSIERTFQDIDEEYIETHEEEDIETLNEEDIEILNENIETHDEECFGEALIATSLLQELCADAAKVNKLGGIKYIPTHKITKLLGILERIIDPQVEIFSNSEDSFEEDCLLAAERVMRAVDASLIALYILTAPNIHKQIYLEDVIDRIIVFTKFQLNNTIYPAYDPVYRMQDNDKDKYIATERKKHTNCKDICNKNIATLYIKLTEVVSLLGELINIQRLTDNSILHASSLGISSFFVDSVNSLQLAALKLVINIFTQYEKHRKLLLDDILASLARLPSSKRSLRSYRLTNDDHIQMLTALVLQLVQSMVILPESISSHADADIIIISKLNAARTITSNFLYVFLTKCSSSRSSEIDYRPIFDNFLHDLLTTVNKPEWPVAELMLNVLGQLLVNNFLKNTVEMPLRLVSLDYLGVVAAGLRKDTLVSKVKEDTINQIVRDIQLEDLKDNKEISKDETKDIIDDDERTQFLQRVLIDYLAMKGESEPVIEHARHFHIAQWYQHYSIETSSNKTNKRTKNLLESEAKLSENPKELKKKFLLSKIVLFKDTKISNTYVDYSSVEIVTRFLASKRPFSQSFDIYLKHILKVLTETSVLIRTKAMKCLTSIVEVDPGVLGLKEMQLGVSHSFLDHSTSVRESAVDLVGKFILRHPELISKYYDMLAARILDTGVSVRKRVIKIFKDLCIEYPNFEKIPEICIKIIRRINDEDGIRKLVVEVFQNMWFTPVREKPVLDSDALMQKVMNIIDVVATSNDVSIQFMEHLLMNLIKTRDNRDERATRGQTQVPNSILTACRQIVDCLVETVLRLDGSKANETSQRLLSCLIMLYLFAKIKPELVVRHAVTIQPYLSLKCQTQEDYQMISCVARTLEVIVPIMKHPSQVFLSCLEEDLVKIMMQQDPSVVQSCVSCLASIVNNLTRNFSLIRDCFKKYYSFLTSYKQISGSILSTSEQVKKLHPSFRRSLFVVGLLLRFFDFTNKELIGDLPETIKDDVFNTFIYFLYNEQYNQHYTLKAIGFVCIRHYELMLGAELKIIYCKYLKDENAAIQIKVQVLNNIESYLEEEDRKMIREDQEWSIGMKKGNLKEMGDIRSGMASTIIQSYLKETLEAFLDAHSSVRNSALRVIQLVLDQGLVHPVQIVPYLICMSSDQDKAMSSIADKKLKEINSKYPGFINMKAQYGIELSYKLQSIIKSDIVRGFRIKEGEPLPLALNAFLYSMLRTKQQRRALLLSMLKHFEEHVKTSLPKMLYLADNMAYFPYEFQDEPLFLIHHIDIILSFTGANLLQSFKDALIPLRYPDQENNNACENEDEDENENVENLLRRVPENTEILQKILLAFQGCLLLLVLKKHLKTLYGFNDAKITLYSPTDPTNIFHKSVIKKNNSIFNPKVTLQKLRQNFPQTELDTDARRSLVSEYLEFKTLIMNLDPDEGEDGPYNGQQRIRELIAEKEQCEVPRENMAAQVRKVAMVMDKVKPNKKRRTL